MEVVTQEVEVEDAGRAATSIRHREITIEDIVLAYR